MSEFDRDSRDQQQVRREKLKKWRQDTKAYPACSKKGMVTTAFCHQHSDDHAREHTIAGRIMLKRVMGKASFMTLQDGFGALQIYARQADLPEGVYDWLKQTDLGDIIKVTGKLFVTQKGELTLAISQAVLLAKSLHPLPEKYHGLGDVETCYRQRYVDLMVNEATRERFKMRSHIIKALRSYLIDQDFLEVETPMMHVMAGGATAKPFATHHHTLDMPLYMRVAPELHLKRLVVGGLDRVFEINRNFRNEGVSTKHNPEFTMVEFYQAYANYEDLIELTQDLLRYILMQVLGKCDIDYQGHHIRFSESFARMTMKEACVTYYPDCSDVIDDCEALNDWLAQQGWPRAPSLGQAWLNIFEHGVEEKLIQPTFITGFPVECSPLARCSDEHPGLTDRFELFVAGFELANAFSELNDPEDQEQRFVAQMQAKVAGDEEAMPHDHDYVRALEYGLPPTAGEGIGIDRLVMLLTNAASIRDVILFPHMRPQSPAS